MYQLYIANKNYSSWSLRPWVLLKVLLKVLKALKESQKKALKVETHKESTEL